MRWGPNALSSVCVLHGFYTLLRNLKQCRKRAAARIELRSSVSWWVSVLHLGSSVVARGLKIDAFLW